MVKERMREGEEARYFADLYLPYILARFPELNVCVWEFRRRANP